jgi:hypothetical protein
MRDITHLAVERAKSYMREWKPHVAIAKASRDFGVTTKTIASELGKRKKHKSEPPADAWWNK